ncbi:MAG: hypothetical protein ACRDRL_16975 [Sciscionella sp.]
MATIVNGAVDLSTPPMGSRRSRERAGEKGIDGGKGTTGALR